MCLKVNSDPTIIKSGGLSSQRLGTIQTASMIAKEAQL